MADLTQWIQARSGAPLQPQPREAPPADQGSRDCAPVDTDALGEQVVEALRTVYDPEIPVNIYDLGLIYRLDVQESGAVDIDMTLTAPGCPVAQTFPGTVEAEILNVPGVTKVHVELVWDPPWTQDRMTEDARLQLGLM